MKIIRQEAGESIFPYIAYIPDNISPNPALLIQLHGAGERGNGGSDLDSVLIHGFSKIATDENLKDCILVMPQCPSGTFWVAKIESFRRFIDQLMEEFSSDPNRVYLCGLSMGGFGTWYTAMAYPSLFAALVPCCGGGMAWYASVLKMPIWAFHGLADDTVSPSQTMEMVEALRGKNENLKYNLFEGVGHNSWNNAFTEETLSWLLAQRKEA